MEILLRFILLVILGIFLIKQGMRLLKGENKAWYFAGYPFGVTAFASIPCGIGVLLWAIASLFYNTSWSLIFVSIGGVFFVFGILAVFVEPSILKPTWLRWLEREYGNSMPIIWKEIHEMGLVYWQDQVETQAELEEWVTNVLSKHGLIGHGELITEQKNKED